MPKNTLSAKVGDRTLERLEDYADEEGISKSEATDRMVKQGLDVEESDMRLVPVQTDGGTEIESQLEHTQSEVRDLSKKVDRADSDFRKVGPAAILCIVWIGIEVAIGIPGTLLTVTSGSAVLGLLLIRYAQVMVSD